MRTLTEVADRLGVETPDGPTDALVSGVTLDSRSVQPGDLYAALSGAKAHGADFAGRAAELGAVACLTDPAGRRAGAGGRSPDVRRGRAAPAARPARGLGLRRAGHVAAHDRRDRDQRQDDDRLPAGVRPARGRPRDRPDRHHRDADRRRGPRQRPDHPGGARPAGAARGDARARRRGRGHGGVQPRAGHASRRRHDVRRGGVHQPDRGPPRLPRRPRGLLRREGDAVHARALAARWSSTSTTRTARGWPGRRPSPW